MKDYYKILEINSNNKYKMLDYKGFDIPHSVFKCNTCKNTFTASLHNVLRKENVQRACPFCEKTLKNATREQIVFKLNKIPDYKYYELSTYDGVASTNSKLLHKACGNDNSVTLHGFFNGNRCRYCNHRSFKLTNAEVDKEISDIDSEYYRKGKYKSLDDKLLLHHNICNKDFYMSFANFRNGSRCPNCWRKLNRSKGEAIIKKVLSTLNVDFEEEYSFSNCKNARKLKFDFYVSDKNLVIEYDGRQHFHEYEFYGGKIKFEKTSENDDIKTNYCLLNNINLLRISYKCTKKDIYDILQSIILDNQISSTTKDKFYYSPLSNYNEYYEKDAS